MKLLTNLEKYIELYQGSQFKVGNYPLVFTVGILDIDTRNVKIEWIDNDDIKQSTDYVLYDVISCFEKNTWTLFTKPKTK